MLDFIIGVLSAAVPAGTPLLFGTLGEILAERSGIMNLGVEGMMLIGAVMGFSAAYYTGNPWLGFALAAFMGGLLSLIHAFISIHLRGNQVVSGLALTMFGTGLSGLLGRRFIGVPLPASAKISGIKIPLLSDIPFLGPLLFRFDPLAYIAIALVPIMWFLLYKTSLGISIRSVGEDPATADAMGVNVFAIRYLCTFIGGVLAGIGGAYLSIVYTPIWVGGDDGRGRLDCDSTDHLLPLEPTPSTFRSLPLRRG